MFDIFTRVFDTSGFPPRWQCGAWSDELGWLHILADLGVWSAYVAIPCVLGYFVLRKQDLPFRSIFVLFGAFILACGTTHLMEAIIFWWPAYRLAGVIKLFTAVVSWGTVIALVPVTPKVLAMRAPEALEREIAKRKDAEDALLCANAELEMQVEALRSSEERFRLLVEGTKDYAIFLLDPDGNVATWNPGAQRIKLYRADEIVGQHFSRFYSQQDVQAGKPERELQVAAAEGKYEEEGWRVRKDGTRFWANVLITALRDEGGKLRGYGKVTRDITEKKEAEENARRLLQEEAARKAAEENATLIREQREELRVTLHSIGDAVIATDAGGRVNLLNPIAETLTGWTTAEAAGRPLPTVFHIVNEETRQPVENPVTKALRLGTVVGLANHTVLIARDGTEHCIDDSAAPIKDEHGTVRGVVLIFRDNREQRARERRRAARLAVTQTLAQANTLSEAAPAILHSLGDNLGWKVGGFWTIDPNAQALRCMAFWHSPSIQGEAFQAVSRQSTFRPGIGLPGRVWSSRQPIWIPDLDKDDNFPRAAAAAHEKLRSGFGFPVLAGDEVLAVVEFLTDETRAPDADLLEMIETVGSQIGQFIQRRRKEEEVRRSEATFKFLADVSAALAGLIDYESTLQSVANVAVPCFADWCIVDMLEPDGSLRHLAIAHVDPAKVLMAHDLQARFPPDPNAAHGVGTILRTGRSIYIPEITESLLVERVKDEKLVRVVRELGLKSYMAVPLKVRDKTLGAITFLAAESGRHYDANDLSVAEELAHRASVALENARLYQEARDADRRKDQFLATLAHELRNPLAPLKNSVQVMRLRGLDDPQVKWARDVIERQVEQMARLVDDLLDISRISRGKVDLRKQLVNLADIVDRAVETTGPFLEDRRHTLTVKLPSDPVLLQADPTRLEQILGNLLHNSAKYTEPGGQVWLTAEREPDTVVIRVRDSGIGIAPELLPHVFDMFVQADHGKERAKGGLGIGLSLVRTLVQLHGGTVTATSGGPGKGSEFVVRLPVLAEGAAGNNLGASPRDASAPAMPARRILVVDDNVDAAESLALLLRMHGHQVRVAHDGQAGLAALGAERPEVVFLDIGMPEMDGYEVARRIRQRSDATEVVLVALTGWGQDEDRRRSRDAGFDRHFVKPVHPEVVQELLANLNQIHGQRGA